MQQMAFNELLDEAIILSGLKFSVIVLADMLMCEGNIFVQP